MPLDFHVQGRPTHTKEKCCTEKWGKEPIDVGSRGLLRLEAISLMLLWLT
jgi:hypothetical protein